MVTNTETYTSQQNQKGKVPKIETSREKVNPKNELYLHTQNEK